MNGQCSWEESASYGEKQQGRRKEDTSAEEAKRRKKKMGKAVAIRAGKFQLNDRLAEGVVFEAAAMEAAVSGLFIKPPWPTDWIEFSLDLCAIGISRQRWHGFLAASANASSAKMVCESPRKCPTRSGAPVLGLQVARSPSELTRVLSRVVNIILCLVAASLSMLLQDCRNANAVGGLRCNHALLHRRGF